MKRRQVLGSMLGTAGVVWLPGCAARAPRPVDFSEADHGYSARDYDRVREHWTRHARLVKVDIGTVIEVWVIYKSWDFRQAYVEQYCDMYHLAEADRRALRKAQLEASRSMYEFHLVAQSTNYHWNELEQRDSVWHISLIDDTAAELSPSSITLEKLPQLYEMRFFPDKTDFSRTYRLRFPHAAADAERPFVGGASGRLRLRLAGPLDAVEVVWQSS